MVLSVLEFVVSDMADLSEFDPLANKSEPLANITSNPAGNGDLYSNSCTSKLGGALETNLESELTKSEVATSSNDSVPDRSTSDPTGFIRSSPVIGRVRDTIKPSRPPPPPPSKIRSASFNGLLEQDTQSNNTVKNPQIQRVTQGKSSFYTDSALSHPSSETNLTRPGRANSSFYVNPSHSESESTLSRATSSKSSFYIAESSQPITIQPESNRLPHPRNMSVVDGDFSDLRGQREQMMQLYMARREEEYTVRKPFKIFAGTWNVNGQNPPEDVKDWLSTKDLQANPPDLYFIGFQELDLSKEAMVFTESLKEEQWKEVIERSLPTYSAKYELLKCHRLVGMMLLVYVKTMRWLSVRNVAFHQVGTGLLGRMGNKGGVAVRFDLNHSSICVVNSHLAAHMEECKRRNEDYHTICSKLRFSLENQPPLSLFQHDIVFWLGDLNYRIQGLDSEVVKQATDVQGYKLLRENDQLLIEKASGNAFLGFSEGQINFRPTYKYNTGTNDWDTSEKCRTPAWCDRVLWWEASLHGAPNKEKQTQSVLLEEYHQHMALKISDHKPVSAHFHVKIKDVDMEKYQRVFEEENRKLDRLENEQLPTLTLGAQQIDFGNVKFQEAKLQTLEIANTGLIPCKFEFICPPGKLNYCQKWLTITSPKGSLFPGDTCLLEFEVYVNRITAPLLNSGKERLDDILILHLIGGKDFFITVSGKYVPSCFGTSIEALCRLRKPIATATAKEIQELSAIPPHLIDIHGEGQSLAVPKELWTLIDHLHRNGKKQADLFQQPGLHSEVEEIRDRLDSTVDTGNGSNKLPGSNHSAAEALLILLEAMPEPVVTFDLYEDCLYASANFYASKQVLLRLSQHHRNVFQYIMSFLRELLRYSESNGLNIELLANVFGGLLLRPRSKKPTVEMRIDRERGKTFVAHFLRNQYDG